MATSVPRLGSIPVSNNGGNNQFSPGAGLPKASPQLPSGAMPGSPTQTNNPFMPTDPSRPINIPMPMGSGTGTTGTAQVPNAGGLDPSSGNTFGSTGGLDKQLKDIWGKGVGGALAKLLEGMSGTDSKVLQEFIASLQPQMAKASADLSSNLGAHGVSANSSVNAIAQGDLQAQEQAAIAGESAKLTMSQEDLTAQILMQMMNPASKEVATSGWSVFADVMNNITGDIGNLIPGAKGSSGGGSSFSAPQLDFGGAPPSAAGVQSYADSLSYGGSPDMGLFE